MFKSLVVSFVELGQSGFNLLHEHDEINSILLGKMRELPQYLQRQPELDGRNVSVNLSDDYDGDSILLDGNHQIKQINVSKDYERENGSYIHQVKTLVEGYSIFGKIAHRYSTEGFDGKIFAEHVMSGKRLLPILLGDQGLNLVKVALVKDGNHYVHFNRDATEFTLQIGKYGYLQNVHKMLTADYAKTVKFFVYKEVDFPKPVSYWMYTNLRTIGTQWVANVPISEIKTTWKDSHIVDEGKVRTNLVLYIETGDTFSGFTELVQEFTPERKEERGDTSTWRRIFKMILD